MNNRRVGERAEDMAAAFLQSRGYRILQRHYRCRLAEIDIIAEAPERTVCFIEVKSRLNDAAGSAAEAVDRRKQRRIALAAQQFLQQHGGDDLPARFDVVAIDTSAARQTITLIENAFEVEE